MRLWLWLACFLSSASLASSIGFGGKAVFGPARRLFGGRGSGGGRRGPPPPPRGPHSGAKGGHRGGRGGKGHGQRRDRSVVSWTKNNQFASVPRSVIHDLKELSRYDLIQQIRDGEYNAEEINSVLKAAGESSEVPAPFGTDGDLPPTPSVTQVRGLPTAAGRGAASTLSSVASVKPFDDGYVDSLIQDQETTQELLGANQCSKNCKSPPGSSICIDYDPEVMAVTMEEALVKFKDPTIPEVLAETNETSSGVKCDDDDSKCQECVEEFLDWINNNNQVALGDFTDRFNARNMYKQLRRQEQDHKRECKRFGFAYKTKRASPQADSASDSADLVNVAAKGQTYWMGVDRRRKDRRDKRRGGRHKGRGRRSHSHESHERRRPPSHDERRSRKLAWAKTNCRKGQFLRRFRQPPIECTQEERRSRKMCFKANKCGTFWRMRKRARESREGSDSHASEEGRSSGSSEERRRGQRWKRQAERQTKPTVTVIDCVRKGEYRELGENKTADQLDKENEVPAAFREGAVGLCNICWVWVKLPDNYFPSIINEIRCLSQPREGETWEMDTEQPRTADEKCLSGHGMCTARRRRVPVLVWPLRADGSVDDSKSWQRASVDVSTCCDCHVFRGSQLARIVDDD